MHLTLRLVQFSQPLRKGGRDAITKKPILREDQLPQNSEVPVPEEEEEE